MMGLFVQDLRGTGTMQLFVHAACLFAFLQLFAFASADKSAHSAFTDVTHRRQRRAAFGVPSYYYESQPRRPRFTYVKSYQPLPPLPPPPPTTPAPPTPAPKPGHRYEWNTKYFLELDERELIEHFEEYESYITTHHVFKTEWEKVEWMKKVAAAKAAIAHQKEAKALASGIGVSNRTAVRTSNAVLVSQNNTEKSVSNAHVVGNNGIIVNTKGTGPIINEGGKGSTVMGVGDSRRGFETVLKGTNNYNKSESQQGLYSTDVTSSYNGQGGSNTLSIDTSGSSYGFTTGLPNPAIETTYTNPLLDDQNPPNGYPRNSLDNQGPNPIIPYRPSLPHSPQQPVPDVGLVPYIDNFGRLSWTLPAQYYIPPSVRYVPVERNGKLHLTPLARFEGQDSDLSSPNVYFDNAAGGRLELVNGMYEGKIVKGIRGYDEAGENVFVPVFVNGALITAEPNAAYAVPSVLPLVYTRRAEHSQQSEITQISQSVEHGEQGKRSRGYTAAQPVIYAGAFQPLVYVPAVLQPVVLSGAQPLVCTPCNVEPVTVETTQKVEETSIHPSETNVLEYEEEPDFD